MSQSLVNQLLDRRKAGEPLGSALKHSIFQAKPPAVAFDGDDNDGDLERGRAPPFRLWKVNMRPLVDDDEVDWWFAATAIPIISSAFAPLANVMSIGALITFWRVDLVAAGVDLSMQLQGDLIPDPRWCFAVNVLSLIFGFLGNLFLVLNFGHRVKYIIALPVSIFLWFLSSVLLIVDLTVMDVRYRPNMPDSMWSGGFWFALSASVLYFMLMVALIINLIGYIRGHYPQHFELTEDQTTLIMQTSLYYIWLAGGAGVFSTIEKWHYIDALYYCTVTVLTIGYGDLYPSTNLGRALLIPWSFGGILILGLVVFSIFKSVAEMGEKNIVRAHYENAREKILGRTVTNSFELERREIEQELERERVQARYHARSSQRSPASVSNKPSINELLRKRSSRMDSPGSSRPSSLNSKHIAQTGSFTSLMPPLIRTGSFATTTRKKNRILLLREEKERFEAMRKIQSKQKDWSNWLRLTVSLFVFASFWLVGAVAFWQLEQDTSGMTYFQSVYFCWVTLVTLGYGDYSPKTWGGRCFFIIWVQFAVPAVTILAQHMTSTVIATFNTSSNAMARIFTHKKETFKQFIYRFDFLVSCIPTSLTSKSKNKQPILPSPTTSSTMDEKTTKELRAEEFASGKAQPDITDLVIQHEDDVRNKGPDASALSRQLALAIRRAARDMQVQARTESMKKYTFEEWVEFTRLIRFSAISGAAEALREEEDEGLVEWDWLAENSPMMAELSEAEFVLERLCESLVRYLRRNPPNVAFADSVKEMGEQALRLGSPGVGQVEDEDDAFPLMSPVSSSSPLSPSSPSSSSSFTGFTGFSSSGVVRPNMVSKMMNPTASSSVGNNKLQPLAEEDDRIIHQ